MEKDSELIKQFNNGNLLSFDKLVKRHLDNTIGFFFNITGNQMTSEDLAHEVFIVLYKKLKNFRFQSKFSTYLYRINMNKANSWIRRNKWRKFLHMDDIKEPSFENSNIEKAWAKDELWKNINRLPKKQRQVVTLRISNELSFKEISDCTGLKEGTAKVNYHHALKTLKKWMNYE